MESNPDPSNNQATTLEDVWSEHGFVVHFYSAAREVQFIWHVLPGASAFEIIQHIQKYLNKQNPESFDERIIFMSMFNDIEWTKQGITAICLHNAKQVAAFATQFKPGHWCFLGSPSEKRGGTEIPTVFQENELWSHYRWLTWSSVTLPTRYFQRGSQDITNSKVRSKKRSFPSSPCWQAIYNVLTIGFASGMRLENWYPHGPLFQIYVYIYINLREWSMGGRIKF